MPQFEQSNNFTENITNRNLSAGDRDKTSTIASSALRRIMQESDSLYKNPQRTDWVQKKIDVFKDNLRAQITHKKLDVISKSKMHWPEEYAMMLKKELEYIETCIEYNDKTGHMPQELVEGCEDVKASPTKKVGHIDLSKPDSKPEWDKEQQKQFIDSQEQS